MNTIFLIKITPVCGQNMSKLLSQQFSSSKVAFTLAAVQSRLLSTHGLRFLHSQCQAIRLQFAKTADAFSLPFRGARRPYVVDSQTQVACDVLIYQYTHDRFFKFLTFFAIVQALYFGQLAWYGMQEVPTARPLPEGASWMTKLIAGRLSYGGWISIFLAGCGAFMVYAAFAFTLRYVNTIHLLRGGRMLRFTTFAPFGKKKTFTVNVNDTSCYIGRQAGTTFIPVKVKGRSLYYLVDKRGEFKNPMLFDFTAGMQRKLS